MRTQKNMITLHGGPWNGETIEDSGTVVVKMGVASEYEQTPNGKRPKRGARVGVSIYEFDDFNESRANAFWLENKWEGICMGTQEAGGGWYEP